MRKLGNTLIYDEEDVEFQRRVKLLLFPSLLVETFPKSTTIVSVENNLQRFKFVNTGTVNVTDFSGGEDGQTIKILGDGFTVLINGTRIFTNTGGNKTLTANRVFTFTKFGANWYEDA